MEAWRATDWINLGAAVFAVSASMYAAIAPAPKSAAAAREAHVPGTVLITPGTLPDGRRALRDATGAWVPLGPYRRIASGSMLADPLLLELCAPDEIVAFSARASEARDAYRYAGKPRVDATRRLEHLVALAPDLVLVNSLGEYAWIERLRDAGLVVFDLGPMWGLRTLLQNILAVGFLVGRPEAARDLAWRFEARMQAVDDGLPPSPRLRALYVGIYGNRMYGGTRGSSYHDVLSHAGLIDVAAERFHGWPAYTPESLLELNPEVIVTSTGGRPWLCDHAELRNLTSCSAQGRVIELDAELLSDAGLGMLDAAEELHRVAYPEDRAR